ncbi:MAG: hypothetical protein HYS34_06135 [Acidobacteria bacterium]|nr:hypothetical protein [Acidobacteriota bacterium]
MSRRARATALLILAHWPAVLAQSWTDGTRTRMIQDALKISPPALREILLRHEKDLKRGMLDPSRREGEEIHFQHADGKGGLGAAGIDRKVAEIRGLLDKRAPFSRVTYELGVLAHLVSDAGFPLNASDKDPREALYREAYRRYAERMLDRIPFVVDREEPAALRKDDVRGFVLGIARRAGENYALIGPAFRDDGTPVSPGALDERSVPFGITSLSYSHAASDIAWIWKHVWTAINGDMRGTPFLGGPPPEKVQVPTRPPEPRRKRTQKDPVAEGSPAPQGSPGAQGSPAPQASPVPRASPSPSAAAAAPKPSPSPTPKGGRT